MKQFNIKDLELEIDMNKILTALQANKKVQIDVYGNVYIDEDINITIPVIYKSNENEKLSSIVSIDGLANNIFKDYKYIMKGIILKLLPLSAWQKIIKLNQNAMLYFDHQTDGVEIFEDKELEDMGWNSIPCDINYREISDFIEANCKGTLVYYDNGIQFNGFVIIEDINEVRLKVKDYLIKTIKQKIEEDLIDIEEDDVIESLEFFNIKV